MDFYSIIEEAEVAASNAADHWLKTAIENGPKFRVGSSELLDVCGNSWIRIKDGRTNFAKYAKEKNTRERSKDNYRTYDISLDIFYENRYRQEYGLHRAAMEAALKVFEKYEIKGLIIYSYVD